MDFYGRATSRPFDDKLDALGPYMFSVRALAVHWACCTSSGCTLHVLVARCMWHVRYVSSVRPLVPHSVICLLCSSPTPCAAHRRGISRDSPVADTAARSLGPTGRTDGC